MKLEPGARIAQYEIVASIGAGGMGQVFRRGTRGSAATSPSR